MDNPNPTTLPAPQRTPVTQPTTPPSLSVEASAMMGHFRALDPTRQGVGLDKLRPFYPRIGWNVIFASVNELVAAGRLTRHPVLNDRGGVAYEHYTWNEV